MNYCLFHDRQSVIETKCNHTLYGSVRKKCVHPYKLQPLFRFLLELGWINQLYMNYLYFVLSYQGHHTQQVFLNQIRFRLPSIDLQHVIIFLNKFYNGTMQQNHFYVNFETIQPEVHALFEQ